MRQTFSLSALLLVALTPTLLHGQDGDEPDHWAAEVGFALNSSGGNEQITVLTTEVELSHLETSVYEAALGGRFRYGRSEGEDVARNLRGTANVDLWPQADWSPFLFATAENDPFRKLDARLNSGAGLKRTFWRDDWSEISLSGGALYSYEKLDLDEPAVGDPPDAGITHSALWSWRGRARRELGDGRRVEQVVFYQPEWDRADDYLLESRTSARWTLTRSLAFNTSFLYTRDSTPAPDVGTDDWSLNVGLTAATRW